VGTPARRPQGGAPPTRLTRLPRPRREPGLHRPHRRRQDGPGQLPLAAGSTGDCSRALASSCRTRLHRFVGQAGEAVRGSYTLKLGGLHVAPHRLRVEPELRRDALLWGPA